MEETRRIIKSYILNHTITDLDLEIKRVATDFRSRIQPNTMLMVKSLYHLNSKFVLSRISKNIFMENKAIGWAHIVGLLAVGKIIIDQSNESVGCLEETVGWLTVFIHGLLLKYSTSWNDFLTWSKQRPSQKMCIIL